MLIENLTPKEYRALIDAVEHALGDREDNERRYKMAREPYPAQDSLDVLRSLAEKLGLAP